MRQHEIEEKMEQKPIIYPLKSMDWPWSWYYMMTPTSSI